MYNISIFTPGTSDADKTWRTAEKCTYLVNGDSKDVYAMPAGVDPYDVTTSELNESATTALGNRLKDTHEEIHKVDFVLEIQEV